MRALCFDPCHLSRLSLCSSPIRLQSTDVVLDSLRSQVSRVQAEEECKRKADADQDDKRARIVDEIKTNKLASGAGGAIAIASDDAPRKKKASVDDGDDRRDDRERAGSGLLSHALASALFLSLFVARRASWPACSADDNRGAAMRSCSVIACSHAALRSTAVLRSSSTFCTSRLCLAFLHTHCSCIFLSSSGVICA